MKFFFRDEVTSTSSIASEWMAQKKRIPLPFAIAARTQTQGRGRRGKIWNSPAGNLYISLALRAKDVGLTQLNFLSLKAAIITADWIAHEFGILVQLKWPNDLFFGGAKLGGILCEASLIEGQCQHIVIGVGINLNKTLLQDPTEYPVTYIAKILSQKKLAHSEKTYAQRFARYWCKHQHEVCDLNVVEKYREKELTHGREWQHRTDSRKALYEGINEEGNLLLRDLAAPQSVITENSGDHAWHLVGDEDDHQQPIAIADVGHTALKIGVFSRGSSVSPEKTIHMKWTQPDPAVVDSCRKFARIWALNVNHQASNAWREKLEPQTKLIEIPKRVVRLRMDQYPLSQIGIDRIAAMEAGISHPARKHMQPLVIVSLGTATTIDAVSPQNAHKGGWIVSGLKTAMHSLHERTSSLPEISEQDILDEIGPHGLTLGQSTKSAMIRGVMTTTFSTLMYLLEEISRYHPRSLCVISGGHAKTMERVYRSSRAQQNVIRKLGLQIVFDEHLILRGAKILVFGGS